MTKKLIANRVIVEMLDKYCIDPEKINIDFIIKTVKEKLIEK